VHIKRTDDETYCGEDAGNTFRRAQVDGIHQVGLVHGKDVCSNCRDAVRDE